MSNVAQGHGNRTREQIKTYFVKQRVPLQTLHVSGDTRKCIGPETTVLSQVLDALQLQSEAVDGRGKEAAYSRRVASEIHVDGLPNASDLD